MDKTTTLWRLTAQLKMGSSCLSFTKMCMCLLWFPRDSSPSVNPTERGAVASVDRVWVCGSPPNQWQESLWLMLTGCAQAPTRERGLCGLRKHLGAPGSWLWRHLLDTEWRGGLKVHLDSGDKKYLMHPSWPVGPPPTLTASAHRDGWVGQHADAPGWFGDCSKFECGSIPRKGSQVWATWSSGAFQVETSASMTFHGSWNPSSELCPWCPGLAFSSMIVSCLSFEKHGVLLRCVSFCLKMWWFPILKNMLWNTTAMKGLHIGITNPCVPNTHLSAPQAWFPIASPHPLHSNLYLDFGIYHSCISFLFLVYLFFDLIFIVFLSITIHSLYISLPSAITRLLSMCMSPFPFYSIPLPLTPPTSCHSALYLLVCISFLIYMCL